MKKTSRQRDSLPESFASEEEAGEFWDTHSTADYEEYLEPVEMIIDIEKRHYLIEIAQDTFMALFHYSKHTHQPVEGLADTLLKERLDVVR